MPLPSWLAVEVGIGLVWCASLFGSKGCVVSGLSSCVFFFVLVVRGGLCHLRCREKWLAAHHALCWICSIFCRMRCMKGGLSFLGARGVLPTSIELVAGGQEKASGTGTWVAGDGVVAICAIFFEHF